MAFLLAHLSDPHLAPLPPARLSELIGKRITGFIHIGTPKLEAPERERPDPRALLTDWIPA